MTVRRNEVAPLDLTPRQKLVRWYLDAVLPAALEQARKRSEASRQREQRPQPAEEGASS